MRRQHTLGFARLGPVAVGWYDAWTRKHGLDIEITVRRRVYAVAFGFGDPRARFGVRTMRGWA